MSRIKPDYSVIVPVFNSCESLAELYRRLDQTFGKLQKSFEVIFIDDGSVDTSWEVVADLQKENKDTVTAVRLAKNYGQHNATVCGIAQANGEYIITIDDDLQNPPEEIEKLIEKMQKCDADLVYGIYDRKQHSMIRNLSSYALKGWSKRLLKRKGEGSSFRLMKASIGKKLLNHQINFIYIDELFNWYTNYITFVYVEHHKRPYQKSNYTSHSLFSMFSNLVIYYTAIPLRMMVYVGIISGLFSFITGGFFIYKKIFQDVPLGFTAIIVTILFSTSMILLSLGIIGEYLSRIYLVQNQKPPYSIKTRLDHEVL